MTKKQFMATLADERPADQLPDTLQSLWWDRKGNWDKAHYIAQNIPTVQGSAVHAYLHREEGVIWNADYWYNSAGRVRPEVSLEEEWDQLVDEMLDSFPNLP